MATITFLQHKNVLPSYLNLLFQKKIWYLLKGILCYFRKSVSKTDADKQILEGKQVNYNTSSQNRS